MLFYLVLLFILRNHLKKDQFTGNTQIIHNYLGSQLACNNNILEHFHAGKWERMNIFITWYQIHPQITCFSLYLVMVFSVINPMNSIGSFWISVTTFQDPCGAFGDTNITHNLHKDHYIIIGMSCNWNRNMCA